MELRALTDLEDLEERKRKMPRFLKCFVTLEPFEETSDLVKNLFEINLNEDFLRALASFLAEIKSLDDDQVQAVMAINARFDPHSREARIVENSLKELKMTDLCTKSTKASHRKQAKFRLTLDFVLSEPQIRPNVIKGSYQSFEDYLSVQKTLIMEDFFRPLRLGLRGLLGGQSEVETLHHYNQGLVKACSNDKCSLELEHFSSTIDWASSSRLIFGSLVILMNDQDHDLSFWTVQERKVNDLLLLELNHIWGKPGKPGDRLRVYESKAYYEAYFHVFQALDAVQKLPFGDCLFKNLDQELESRIEIQNLDKNFYKNCNPSQMDALKLALRKRVALIQGPPGTGKSYVGTVLSKILIQEGHSGPLVVICFTNHALDHFLESLVGFTDKIVRIGSRSKSSLLDRFNLQSIRREMAEQRTRHGQIYKTLKSLDPNSKAFKDWIEVESAQILAQADVVGLTTTGAAKNARLLKMLDPKIMLIEESGQVLESHILASLTPNLEQLILIGDHQQLKPSVTTYDLAKKFNLNVSLFERLILNGFEFVQLLEQHRMRPEISALVRNEFYAKLRDHDSVELFQNVKGVAANVFFVHHSEQEQGLDESLSKVNRHEAEFLVKLAQHLINQGYKPSQITILAAYLGQMMLLQRLCTNNPEILITVVDNYQGEENDIVLLSLVRSNQTASIGFLSMKSRICVALSRAKKGLYIIGNMTDLSQGSSTWQSIKIFLEKRKQIGHALELQCAYHPNDNFNVAKAEDFPPEDFCRQKCGERLFCGHLCTFQCHKVDREHRKSHACAQACSRTCPRGHTSQVTCGNALIQGCQFQVELVLDCGHCQLKACSDNNLECREICSFLLDCGHACSLPCHQDQHHNSKCLQKCSRPKRKCSSMRQAHLCDKLCHQSCNDCDEIIRGFKFPDCGHALAFDVKCSQIETGLACQKKCDKVLPCGLHRCKNFCYECKDHGGCPSTCSSLVERACAKCGHVSMAPCLSMSNDKCLEECKQLLHCGHKCPLKCWQDCSKAQCQVLVTDANNLSECGHQTTQICGGGASKELVHCLETCGKSLLNCGHLCSYKCWECTLNNDLVLHLPCKDKCQKTLICGHQCPGVCGQVCPPCSKLKCLFHCGMHQKKCRSTCEDNCAPCKEKCSFGCGVHANKCKKKCSNCGCQPCFEKCLLKLKCGHPCQGFCGQTCPQDACGQCNPSIDAKAQFVAFECGHFAEKSRVSALMEDQMVGIAECPQCSGPIGHLPLFRHQMQLRKRRIVQVFDDFFARKSNLIEAKQALANEDNLTILEPALRNFVSSRCQQPISFQEFQNLSVKILLTRHLSSIPRDLPWKAKLWQTLNSPEFVLGPDFTQGLLQFLEEEKFPVENVCDFKLFSFAKGSWMMQENGALTLK